MLKKYVEHDQSCHLRSFAQGQKVSIRWRKSIFSFFTVLKLPKISSLSKCPVRRPGHQMIDVKTKEAKLSNLPLQADVPNHIYSKVHRTNKESNSRFLLEQFALQYLYESRFI